MKYRKILLVRPPLFPAKEGIHTRQIYPPFSLRYIEQILKNRFYDVKLIDCYVKRFSIKGLKKDILNWQPHVLIVLSNVSYNYDWVRNFVFSIKKVKEAIFSVIIGEDITINPGRYINNAFPFDAGIRGEAEEEVPNLIDMLNSCEKAEDIKQYYFNKLQRDEIAILDLDNLPFPRYSKKEINQYSFLYPLPLKKKVRWGFILSSRGCSHGCRFCSSYIRKTMGKTVRFRSPFKVVDEIEYLKSHGVNMVSFEDDDFTINRNHVLGICREIRERKLFINWSCHAHLDELDQEILSEMKDAGCILLVIGVESGSANVHRFLGKFKIPEEALEKSYKVFKEIKNLGISTNALFMLNLPGETEKDLEKSIDLAKKLLPDTIQLHFFTPYSDTKLYLQFKEKINFDYACREYHYSFPIVNLSDIPMDILVKKYFEFYIKYYFNFSFFRNHIAKYGIFYILNPAVTIALIKVLAGILKKNILRK